MESVLWTQSTGSVSEEASPISIDSKVERGRNGRFKKKGSTKSTVAQENLNKLQSPSQQVSQQLARARDPHPLRQTHPHQETSSRGESTKFNHLLQTESLTEKTSQSASPTQVQTCNTLISENKSSEENLLSQELVGQTIKDMERTLQELFLLKQTERTLLESLNLNCISLKFSTEQVKECPVGLQMVSSLAQTLERKSYQCHLEVLRNTDLILSSLRRLITPSPRG